MLDKRNQPYDDYLAALERQKFTGRVVLDLNWKGGIISNMNRESTPLPGVTERKSIVLKQREESTTQ